MDPNPYAYGQFGSPPGWTWGYIGLVKSAENLNCPWDGAHLHQAGNQQGNYGWYQNEWATGMDINPENDPVWYWVNSFY